MIRQPRFCSTRVLKLSALIVLPFAVVVGGIMLLFYHFDTQASVKMLRSKEVNMVDLQKETIVSDFATVATDLVFLAKTAHLHHIYHYSNKEEVGHVAEEFETFVKRKGLYDQVRYIDISGREIVRVNYNNGEPFAVPAANLQNKSGRYYFKESVSLALDEIYVSPFDLNVEHGEVEYPYRSIIRFGTPVFDEKGVKRGVLLLNYMGANIKRHLDRLATSSTGSIMLLNSAGYWLHAPSADDEWGFALEERKGLTFGARYPDEWARVNGAESGQFRTSRGLVTFESVYPYRWVNTPGLYGTTASQPGLLPTSKSPVQWKVVSFIDSATLAKSSGQLAKRLLLTYLFFISIIVTGAWLTAYSFSSKKAADRARSESEARYKMVHTTSLDSIIITDSSGVITEVNPRTADLFGYECAELIGMEFARLIGPGHVAGSKAGIAGLLEAGSAGTQGGIVEFEGVRKDGRRLPVEALVSCFAIGSETFFSATLRDITARRLMESTLKESEAMYRGLVTTSQNLIWRCDNAGRLTYLNPAWEKTFGYTVAQMIGRRFADFQPPDAAAQACGVFNGSGSAEVAGHETLCRSSSGKDVYLVFNALPMQDKDGAVIGRQGTANDITEHKRLEKRLRTLSHAIEQIPTSVIITDIEGVIEYVNPKFISDHGYTLPEVLGRNISTLYSDLASESYYNDLRGEVLDGAVWQGNVRFKKKSAETVWELITVSAVLGIEGGSTHLLIVKIDDTERKRAEEALKRSEASLAAAQRIAHVGSWDWDMLSNVVIWSDEAYRIFGFEPHSVKADYGLFMDVVHPDDRSMIDEHIREALSNTKEYRVEHRIIHQDGTERVVLEHGEVEFNEEGTPVRMIGTVSDVTEHNRLEVEVIKAQKLESIGVLAGGIAHDFNNILTAMLGNISMAKIGLDPGSTVCKRLTEAEKAIGQARGLTQQLLTFSKGGAPVKSVVGLGPVVRDTALFALRGSNVKINDAIAPDLWPANVDEGQIVQVVNNLIINAVQSMPEGGEIRLECSNVDLSAGSVTELDPGEYIRITVEDRGCGIDKENISKIFDPYYTTKEYGSGLGLAAAYSIIEKHGGHIEVDSVAGAGTTFRVYLKATHGLVVEHAADDSAVVKGTGRVLVMDDDEGVRNLLTEMLNYLGYEVETVADGAAAIESYRAAFAGGSGFDAVIMDLTIPGGLGGGEAIKDLLKIDPGVRAIVSSGYSNDPVMAEYGRYGFSGVVAKPYLIGKLSQVLHDVISNG